MCKKVRYPFLASGPQVAASGVGYPNLLWIAIATHFKRSQCFFFFFFVTGFFFLPFCFTLGFVSQVCFPCTESYVSQSHCASLVSRLFVSLSQYIRFCFYCASLISEHNVSHSHCASLVLWRFVSFSQYIGFCLQCASLISERNVLLSHCASLSFFFIIFVH